MKYETVKALFLSRDHWLRLRDEVAGEVTGSSACPLCVRFNTGADGREYAGGCTLNGEKCPIFEQTGHSDCIGSPYYAAESVISNNTPFRREKCQKMVDFITELIPEAYRTPPLKDYEPMRNPEPKYQREKKIIVSTQNEQVKIEEIGLVIDGSCDVSEQLDLDIIEYVSRKDPQFVENIEIQELIVHPADYPVILTDIANEAVEWMNDNWELPLFCYFVVDDNCLYLRPDIEGAKEGCKATGLFVSSKEQEFPPNYYEGIWLHISDHGNATLYERKSDKEIWSIV